MAATKSLPWSTTLINVLLEELYAAEGLEEMLGPPSGLQPTQYPQAVALAIILRHSWRADDLAYILERLGLPMVSP